MKTFQERSDALTGSACLKKAVDVQHQGNSTTCEAGQAAIRPYCQVGDFQHAKARDSGIAISESDGAALVGECGTAIVGDRGTASAGKFGTATAGLRGKAFAGHKGTASDQTFGEASTGVMGTATAGDVGTASVGDRGVANAGLEGIASAGEKGEIRIRYYDGQVRRCRTKIGYIGENGLQPNPPYTLNEHGDFVPVSVARGGVQ
jgi:hypothetical protein